MRLDLPDNFWLYVAIAVVSAASFVVMFHLSSQLQ